MLCGVIYSIGGAIIYTLVSMDLLSSEAMSTPGLSYGSVLALGALIAMPAIGAVTGFVGGCIEALLFNLFASWFGGIKIDFKYPNGTDF